MSLSTCTVLQIHLEGFLSLLIQWVVSSLELHSLFLRNTRSRCTLLWPFLPLTLVICTTHQSLLEQACGSSPNGREPLPSLNSKWTITAIWRKAISTDYLWSKVLSGSRTLCLSARIKTSTHRSIQPEFKSVTRLSMTAIRGTFTSKWLRTF